MINIVKKVYKKIHIIQNIFIKNKFLINKKSYAMEGEDLEIVKILKNIKDGFYVDAGGYHPLDRNNTYLLYKKNWRGINIDLSEFSIDLFNFIRPEDININVAVKNSDDKAIFYYQKKLSQLTTIKKEIANQRMQGHIKEMEIKSNKLTTIINNTKYKNRKIDFLNIDVEGHEMNVMDGSLSLIKKCSPLIILEFSKFIPPSISISIFRFFCSIISFNFFLFI